MEKYLKIKLMLIPFLLTFLLILTYLCKIPVVENLELKTIDYRFSLRGKISGSEIHANIVDSKKSNKIIEYLPHRRLIDIITMAAAGVLLGLFISRLRLITGMFAAAGLIASYIIFCHCLFVEKGIILNIAYPVCVLLIGYISIAGLKIFNKSNQKKIIKNAFSDSLSPRVVQQMIDSKDKIKLDGEKRIITALFSDVENFAGIARHLEPKEVVALLNAFLTEMVNIIQKHNGYVAKFAGDAIVAFFGAPNSLANHAQSASMACIEMQNRLDVLQDIWKKQGKPELLMRCGLCTGSAILGDINPGNHTNYTMIGDTVNIAARLIKVNKIYGTYTLISETTYETSGQDIIAREVDSISISDNIAPVTIYELLGYDDKINDSLMEMTDFYIKGLYAYRNHAFEKGANYFQNALTIMPDDPPSRVMLQRCYRFIDTPPPENWDSIFKLKR